MDHLTLITYAVTPAPWWVTLFAPTLAALVSVLVGALVVTRYLTRRNTEWALQHQTDFRADLVSDMARVAHSLRLEAKVYRRKHEKDQFLPGEKEEAKKALDQTYLNCRKEGEAIEVRLQVHMAEKAATKAE